jgi:hypothetical protein
MMRLSLSLSFLLFLLLPASTDAWFLLGRSPSVEDDVARQGFTTKLFFRYARDVPKCRGDECSLHLNRVSCESDRYCSYQPDRILCTERAGFPANDSRAVWSCDGRVSRDDVEMASHVMECEGGAALNNPRYGCVLHLNMSGPWTGWSWTTEMIYNLVIFIFCVILFCLWVAGGGKTGVLIGGGGGGGGGSHMSSSFG